MTTEEGIVTEIRANMALVRTTRSAACKSCSAHGSCNAVGEDMSVEAMNPAGARVGDRVLISIKTTSFLKVTLLLYALPVAALIAGAALGHNYGPRLGIDASVLSALAGFGAFVASLIFVKFKGNRMAADDAYRPKIVRTLH